MTRAEKVLKYLKEQEKEVSNDDLCEETGISPSNMSKILKPLEKEGKIRKRYEQQGRAKYVYISLTNSHTNSEVLTNSQPKQLTNSRLNTYNKTPKVSKDKSKIKEVSATNSQPKQLTNSRLNTYNKTPKVSKDKSKIKEVSATNSQPKQLTNSNIKTNGHITISRKKPPVTIDVQTGTKLILEKVIKFLKEKSGADYQYILRVLTSTGNNYNYLRFKLEDLIQILIEMRLIS